MEYTILLVKQINILEYFCDKILHINNMRLFQHIVWTLKSCMCNELGIGQRRLYSDATGVGRSGSHKEQQTHTGDGISWSNE